MTMKRNLTYKGHKILYRTHCVKMHYILYRTHCVKMHYILRQYISPEDPNSLPKSPSAISMTILMIPAWLLINNTLIWPLPATSTFSSSGGDRRIDGQLLGRSNPKSPLKLRFLSVNCTHKASIIIINALIQQTLSKILASCQLIEWCLFQSMFSYSMHLCSMYTAEMN